MRKWIDNEPLRTLLAYRDDDDDSARYDMRGVFVQYLLGALYGVGSLPWTKPAPEPGPPSA